MKSTQFLLELSVADLQESLYFYTDILEFSRETKEHDDVAIISYQGRQILLKQQTEKDLWILRLFRDVVKPKFRIMIEVQDLQKWKEKVQAKEYPLDQKTQDTWVVINNTFHGKKEFEIRDPDGYLLCFFQDLGEEPTRRE